MENIQNQNANGTGHKPEAVIRDGSLKATIWRNVNNEGQAYYSTSLAKIYTDAQGNPRDTKNFSQSDLLRVAELSRDAYAKISEMKRGHSQEQSQGHNTQQDREAFKQSRRQSNAQNMQSQTQGY